MTKINPRNTKHFSSRGHGGIGEVPNDPKITKRESIFKKKKKKYSHRTYCLTFHGIWFLQKIKYLFFNDLRHFRVISVRRGCVYSVIPAFQSTSRQSFHCILTVTPRCKEEVIPFFQVKRMRLRKLRLGSHVTASSQWNKDQSRSLLDLSTVLFLLLLVNLHHEFSGTYTYFSEIFVNVPTLVFPFFNGTYL